MVVWVHGGPTGQWPVTFNPRIAYFVGRGWAVLVPDHRGSTGFGRAYTQAMRGRWGELDTADVAAGIRHAGAQGWCDPRRVAIMGGSAGGFTVLNVLAHHPDIRFLALSVSDAPEDVIAVIRAGARGYVTKTISGDELIDAIRRVADDDAVFSPRLAGFVLDAFSHVPVESVDPELDQLTAREREVLRLIARGYAYKEIARQLGISAKTVETHVSSVLRKLQLSNRHELTRWATERRIV